MRVIGTSVIVLNLEFLIADILEEQRNLTFTIFKRMYVYRVSRFSRDPICQNKGVKHIESFRPSNRRWRSNRGLSYNIHFKDDEEGFKDVKIELELEFEL